jgi:hypothetical protein
MALIAKKGQDLNSDITRVRRRELHGLLWLLALYTVYVLKSGVQGSTYNYCTNQNRFPTVWVSVGEGGGREMKKKSKMYRMSTRRLFFQILITNKWGNILPMCVVTKTERVLMCTQYTKCTAALIFDRMDTEVTQCDMILKLGVSSIRACSRERLYTLHYGGRCHTDLNVLRRLEQQPDRQGLYITSMVPGPQTASFHVIA